MEKEYSLIHRHWPDCRKEKFPTTTTTGAGNNYGCTCGTDEIIACIDDLISEVRRLHAIIALGKR